MTKEPEIIEEKKDLIVKPACTPQDLSEALQKYKSMQEMLDKAMPDCIMTIKGKKFRKKNYWRAVKTYFNLSVECVSEEIIKLEDDWGYVVTYRATANNGASCDGDGSCTYSEKDVGEMKATLHNIRSQAHTRACNRAISNLVAFGEVSADEVYQGDIFPNDVDVEAPIDHGTEVIKNPSPQRTFNPDATINEKQARLLVFKRNDCFKDTSITSDEFRGLLVHCYKIDPTKVDGKILGKNLTDIKKSDFQELLDAVQSRSKFDALAEKRMKDK
jgi:hypothetical protein